MARLSDGGTAPTRVQGASDGRADGDRGRGHRGARGHRQEGEASDGRPVGARERPAQMAIDQSEETADLDVRGHARDATEGLIVPGAAARSRQIRGWGSGRPQPARRTGRRPGRDRPRRGCAPTTPGCPGRNPRPAGGHKKVTACAREPTSAPAISSAARAPCPPNRAAAHTGSAPLVRVLLEPDRAYFPHHAQQSPRRTRSGPALCDAKPVDRGFGLLRWLASAAKWERGNARLAARRAPPAAAGCAVCSGAVPLFGPRRRLPTGEHGNPGPRAPRQRTRKESPDEPER